MAAMLKGDPPPTFSESPEEHQRRVHPDLRATQDERRQLEAAITKQFSERKGL